MGSDLQSSILQVGKALNSPVQGVSALAESGIQFTETQKKMIAGLVRVGNVAGAQSIILKELETQFGGQAEALVNPIKQAENAWGDFMEVAGKGISDKLLPLMPKLISAFEQLGKAGVASFEAMDNALSKWERANLKWFGFFTGHSDAEMNQSLKEMRDGEAAVKAGRPGPAAVADFSKIPGMMPKGFNPADMARDRVMKQWEKPAFSAMSSFVAKMIEQGLSAYMSLGPQAKERGPQRLIGSLEQNSEHAFEVLRSNVSRSDKGDTQKNQLKETQAQTKVLKAIEKKIGKPAGGHDVRIGGID
jgi:hypothetical protein